MKLQMKNLKTFTLMVTILFIMGMLAACGSAEQSSNSGGNNPSNDSSATNGNDSANQSDFPNKPVNLIITHGAGGGTDLTARLAAKYMEKYLGEKVIPQNREGSGGRIARAFVYDAEPDGYNILATGMPSTQLGEMLYDGQYDTSKYTYIYNVAGNDFGILLVKKDGPYASFADLQEAAKNKTINISTDGGFGSGQHLQSVMLKQKAELPHNLVPFDSDGASLAALLGGHVDAAMNSSVYGIPGYPDEVIPVAVYAPERVDALPDVPTFAELGFEDMVVESQIGIVGPPNMPQDIVDTLAAALEKAVNDPEMTEEGKKIGVSLNPMSPDEYKKSGLKIYEDMKNNYVETMKAEMSK